MEGVHLQRICGEIAQLGDVMPSPVGQEAREALRAVALLDEHYACALAREIEPKLRGLVRGILHEAVK